MSVDGVRADVVSADGVRVDVVSADGVRADGVRTASCCLAWLLYGVAVR